MTTTETENASTATDRLDSIVGCDHLLGYTWDYEGPSIFSASTENPTWEFDEGFVHEDEHHGITWWSYCPLCGEKLNPPNANCEPQGSGKDDV